MKKAGATVIVLSSICLFAIFFANVTYTQALPETITYAEIRTIMPPVAGHYPSSFFMNPYKPGTNIKNNFTQTLIWEPHVTRTFALNTVYTAIVVLTPIEDDMTFLGTNIYNFRNLPAANDVSFRIDGQDLLIYIEFEATCTVWSPPIELFFDDFSSGLRNWAYAPEEVRHGLTSWQSEMVNIVDNQLVLSFEKRPDLAPEGTWSEMQENFIAAGAVRTQQADGSTVFFENAFGFYEARIKFPQVDGMWGSFRLKSPGKHSLYLDGRFSSDINIVETFESSRANGFNVSWEWGQHEYGRHRYGPSRFTETDYEYSTTLGINIFDGNFHTFALDWSPTEYVFFVNGQVIYRSYALPISEMGGISKNPNFLELSIEAAPWVGLIPGVAEFSGYMIVDYVRVLNGPKYDIDIKDNLEIRTVNAPVAGHFPSGFFKNPFRANSNIENQFTQTLTWYPQVARAFLTNTVYTATVRLSPRSPHTSFYGITLNQIGNLPQTGSKVLEYDAGDVLIHITFDATASINSAPEVVFFDDFTEGLNQWEPGPEWMRHGLSMWQDDLSFTYNNRLILGFEKRPHLAPAGSSQTVRDYFIAAGGVRTRSVCGERIYFENAFGLYEARIRFPRVDGMWGAFWLVGPTMGASPFNGVLGKEIDIVETFYSYMGYSFGIALHWNGYGRGHMAHSPPPFSGTWFPGFTPIGINIFDGEFHTFALEWSPSEYVFMVNEQVIYRTNAQTAALRSGISQNPNYLKLTIEASLWAGTIDGISQASGIMEVDFVRVLNGPAR